MPTPSPKLPRLPSPTQASFARIVSVALAVLALSPRTTRADHRVPLTTSAQASRGRHEARALRTRLEALMSASAPRSPRAAADRPRARHRRRRGYWSAKARRVARARAKRPAHLARDLRLDRVAEANSLALAEVDGEVPAGALAFLRFELHRAHVHDALLRATVLRYRAGEPPPIPTQLRRALADRRYTHLGVGVAPWGKRWIATVVLVRRLVTITQAKISKKRWLRVCGRPRHRGALTVLLTCPRGAVLRRRPNVRHRRFCAWFPATTPGRYQVEVTAPGPYGPEVASLFPIYVGVPPPRHPEERLYPHGEEDTAKAEVRLLRLINQSRRRARLRPLRRDAKLAWAARHHSRDMATQSFFGHVSPRFGDLQRRMSLAGLGSLTASENLALATSARRAHDALLDSPTHREVLLDPHAVAVGIGVVRARTDGLLYITECFAWRPDTP